MQVSFVHIPPSWGVVRDMVSVEDVWHLGTEASAAQQSLDVECVATCHDWPSCEMLNGTYVNWWTMRKTPDVFRDLITEKGRLRCGETPGFHALSESTLTMHMRS